MHFQESGVDRNISIHSLHTEGDTINSCNDLNLFQFQSTPSTRRETCACIQKCSHCNISIHSLHTEGDKVFLIEFVPLKHFNPLPPHGGRPMSCCCWRMLRYFNPLPPHGGRPVVKSSLYPTISISIHSLHTEGDIYSFVQIIKIIISIHSLHTEGDCYTNFI